MTRQLLVVLFDGASRVELEAAVAGSDEGDAAVYIVAPTHVGPLEWLATDESRAQGEAAARVLEAEWLLAGVSELGGEAGESDPVVAVGDALERFAADEIVLVGSGEVDSSFLSSLRVFGLPVTLSGVTLVPSSVGSRARARVRGLTSGRSAATPFAAFLAANLGLLMIAVLGVLIVALVVWLIGAL